MGPPGGEAALWPDPPDAARWAGRCAAGERWPPGRPTVLSVARMYPRKRLGDLLQAAAILRGRIPGVQIRIVGDGPESRRLRALHGELGLGDAAVLLCQVSPAQLSLEYVCAPRVCLPTVQ